MSHFQSRCEAATLGLSCGAEVERAGNGAVAAAVAACSVPTEAE
jgi:hypothetical protein